LVFKRRDALHWTRWATDLVYPRSGWRRATNYVLHRLRRLPDKPQRIARGLAAGMFVNFPPLFGVQMVSAALLAWAVRGNVLAALLATFATNPLTTPFVALGSLELGHWMLGTDMGLEFEALGGAFANAGVEIWENVLAIFGPQDTHWYRLETFFHTIYLPYLVGSLPLGVVFSVASYYLSQPLIEAYQKLRSKRLMERVEKRRTAERVALAEAEAEDWQALAEDAAEGAPPPNKPET
jgi:uncharacterized protein